MKQDDLKIGIVGLGYVGINLAVEFSKKEQYVVGYDRDVNKIQKYKEGIDLTGEFGDDIKLYNIKYTHNSEMLRKCNFILICVPTDIYGSTEPNLMPLKSVSKDVGRMLTENTVVIYESTVYPGVTQEVCIPILEQISGMKCGEGFLVGYSPERIIPGKNQQPPMKKLIAGCNIKCTQRMALLYELIAETYACESIETAEATKIIENAQKDINIAFLNEVSVYLKHRGIQTTQVLNAMRTRSDCLYYKPGLVGGHCIGVDTYWLINAFHKAMIDCNLMVQARKTNEDFIKLITEKIKDSLPYAEPRVAFLGITYKADVSDTRNSAVIKIIESLKSEDIECIVHDDHVNLPAFKQVSTLEEIIDIDCLVIAVPHTEYSGISVGKFYGMFKKDVPKKIIDLTQCMIQESVNTLEFVGFDYWKI
jgi:UDP-N-acetyl-D-glucosamine/UDP-N-acetyl-D-galactosamine dehydrogenase